VKKFILFSLTFLLIVLSVNSQTLLDKPVATINLIKPEMISQRQLNRQFDQIVAIQQQSGNTAPLVKSDVLDLMISEKLMNQGIEEAGIVVDSTELQTVIGQQKASIEQQNGIVLTDVQFQSVVQQQMGVTWDQYVQQISLQIKQQKYLQQEKQDVLTQGQTTPSFDEIEQFYRKSRSQFTNPEIIRFSHIYITTDNLSSAQKMAARAKADEVYRKLQNGSSFDTLVGEYSEDNASKYKGGDAGYIAINDQRPINLFGDDFVNKLFAMDQGETSRVLTSLRGFHIVKIDEYHSAKLLELNDTVTPDSEYTVREYIANGLMSQKQQATLELALQQLVEDLKQRAEVTIFEENL